MSARPAVAVAPTRGLLSHGRTKYRAIARALATPGEGEAAPRVGLHLDELEADARELARAREEGRPPAPVPHIKLERILSRRAGGSLSDSDEYEVDLATNTRGGGGGRGGGRGGGGEGKAEHVDPAANAAPAASPRPQVGVSFVTPPRPGSGSPGSSPLDVPATDPKGEFLTAMQITGNSPSRKKVLGSKKLGRAGSVKQLFAKAKVGYKDRFSTDAKKQHKRARKNKRRLAAGKKEKYITHTHEQYALTFAMMLGIRRSVDAGMHHDGDTEVPSTSAVQGTSGQGTSGQGGEGEGGVKAEGGGGSNDDSSSVPPTNMKHFRGGSGGEGLDMTQQQHATMTTAMEVAAQQRSVSSMLDYSGSFMDDTSCDVPLHELSRRDYMHTNTWRFKPAGTATTPPYGSPHFTAREFEFKDYAPAVFAKLRGVFGVDTEHYLDSLCGGEANSFIEFISNSKSGQFFYFSHDKNYMIKTQSRAECQFLRRIMLHYTSHMTNNPNSMMIRFFGMHRVKLPSLRREVHFVIMNNALNVRVRGGRMYYLPQFVGVSLFVFISFLICEVILCSPSSQDH